MIPTQSLSRFIHQQQRAFPGSSGELSDLLSSLALASKLIRKLVQTAGFRGLHGYTGATNVQGEQVHEIDQEADEILVEILGSTGHFGLLVSEERETVIACPEDRSGSKYVVAFDPLDGSSNLGSNVPVGTIFSIFRKQRPLAEASKEDFLQPARGLVAAGYVVYGARTEFVYSSGQGVHGFTFDPTIGEFLLTAQTIQMPAKGKTYSINEGYESLWYDTERHFIRELKSPHNERGAAFSARYVGSLIADFDRILRKGGIFLYPRDKKNAHGKLRLLYECMPLAFLAHQAGGRATDGQHLLIDVTPRDIHQRSPLIIGSAEDVAWYERIAAQGNSA